MEPKIRKPQFSHPFSIDECKLLIQQKKQAEKEGSNINSASIKFNEVSSQRHLNLDNLLKTTLALFADNPNNQPLPDEEKDKKKIKKRTVQRKPKN
jgi:hypothetical protein